LVHQRNVAVVVDRSCCLPSGLSRDWDITVVPHELIVGGRPYQDGVDIQPQKFYRLLRDNQARLATAAPQPQRLVEAFIKAGQLAPNVLCLTLSACFSVTFRSAMAAKSIMERDAESRGKFRVEVVDTQAAAGAVGLIALAAARWAARGQSLDQVMNGVGRLAPRVDLLAFRDTLGYLGRSGRIGRFQTLAGTLLGIKPLTELRLGEARVLEKPRSRARAIQRLLEIMGQRVGSTRAIANVMEADVLDDAQGLLAEMKSRLSCAEGFVSQFTPVMDAHTGPGLLGVAFYPDTADVYPNQWRQTDAE
jgi:DegV family protein with EDD domain